MASTTLAQYRSRISAKIGLDNTTTGDQTLIDDWVNEAYERVLLDTKCKITSASAALTSGQGDYTLDTGIMRTIDVYTTASAGSFKMERVSLEDLLSMRMANTVGSSPVRYYSTAGSNMISVFPTPSSADTLWVYYVARPTALSASSSVPSDVPEEFHKLIELAALVEAADYDDDTTSEQGQRYAALYQQGVMRLRKAVVQKGGSKVPRMRVGRSGSLVGPTVPSQDWQW